MAAADPAIRKSPHRIGGPACGASPASGRVSRPASDFKSAHSENGREMDTMAMTLKPGARFKSAVCDTQVMVVTSPAGAPALRRGGAARTQPAAAGGGQSEERRGGNRWVRRCETGGG